MACIQCVVRIHLTEQVKLIELETEQASHLQVKSHGQYTYLPETMKSSKPEYYANAPLLSRCYAAILYFCIFK